MSANPTESEYNGFELGPIRPPSEAQSLLIRVTRNCAWNRCTFCPVYKGKSFSTRPTEDVIRDIDVVHGYVQELRHEFKDPYSVTADWQVKATDEADPHDYPALDMAYQWFMNGMKTVFLQDSDALTVGIAELVRILEHLRSRFPSIERVTSYSRSSTLVKASVDDLIVLREAGLDRIHVGLESGSDNVLKMVRKGASKDMHIRAGRLVKDAGIELSEYVMPGLGGQLLSHEHAVETADALSQINPDFIRMRQLAIPDRAPLSEAVHDGRFVKCTDLIIAQEMHTMLENLEGVTSIITSDHLLDLFPEITGKLPEAQEKMCSVLQTFISMPPSDQRTYCLGRRIGVFSRVSDINDPAKLEQVQYWKERYELTESGVDEFLDRVVQSFI